MSHKAFYQTFYQTEQLFRRANEVLAFPVLEEQATQPVEAVAVLPQAPTVQIVDTPVLTLPPPEPVVEVIVEAVLVEETVVIDVPVALAEPEPIAQPEPARQLEQQAAEPTPLRPATPMLSQKVLILVDEDLLASDLLFLEKILKAVNLDVTGVDLLNIHGTKNINFNEILAGKYIHHFFTFGVPFTRLNLDILMDRYQPVRFDGITFLMADPLPAIEGDVALKKKLWEALKKIFMWR